MPKMSHFLSKKGIGVLLLILAIVAGALALSHFSRNKADSRPEQQLSRLAANLSGGFKAQLEISCDGFSANADFQQQYLGDCQFRFTSPPSLDGFVLTVREGQAELSYRGLASTQNTDQFFSSSGAGLFLEPEVHLRPDGHSSGLQCEQADGQLLLSLPSGENENRLLAVVDAESGTPVSVEFPQEGCVIRLNEVTFSCAQ